MKKIIQKILNLEEFRFLLVGGCSTGIDFFVYMLISLKLSVTISKTISMLVSSIFSYFVNKNYTFENRDKTNAKYLIKFYLVFAANIVTNVGVNTMLYYVTGYKLLAYVLATAVGMTVNYFGQRFIVFSIK